jgi:hypothetical protein
MDGSSDASARLEKIERTIVRQKEFIRRVPDPDNRAAAEDHLIALVRLRDELIAIVPQGSDAKEASGTPEQAQPAGTIR